MSTRHFLTKSLAHEDAFKEQCVNVDQLRKDFDDRPCRNGPDQEVLDVCRGNDSSVLLVYD